MAKNRQAGRQTRREKKRERNGKMPKFRRRQINFRRSGARLFLPLSVCVCLSDCTFSSFFTLNHTRFPLFFTFRPFLPRVPSASLVVCPFLGFPNSFKMGVALFSFSLQTASCRDVSSPPSQKIVFLLDRRAISSPRDRALRTELRFIKYSLL